MLGDSFHSMPMVAQRSEQSGSEQAKRHRLLHALHRRGTASRPERPFDLDEFVGDVDRVVTRTEAPKP